MFKKYFVFVFIALCVVPFAFASAMTVKEGQNITLSKGETINDSVLLAGSNIIVNNDISGDVFAFGQRISINGNVDGDIIGAAQSITINGNVTGSVRVASQNIEINGRVERSVLGAGQTMVFSENSFVGRDVTLAGEAVSANGTILGSLTVAATTANINGKVSKNVNFYSQMGADANTGLFLAPTATVSGNIYYRAFGDVKGASTTNVLGIIDKVIPQPKHKVTATDQALAKLGFLISLLLTVLVIVLAGGKKTKDFTEMMVKNVWKSFGVGFAVLICSPILGIILLVTGFGAWLGFILIIAWVLMMILSMIMAAIAFGQYGMFIFKKKFSQNFLIYSLIGAVAGFILLIIPVIGFLAGFFGMCWGIGGMFLSFLECRKEKA
jgi:cytoskeletal protein CcmA (bactofilin family)